MMHCYQAKDFIKCETVLTVDLCDNHVHFSVCFSVFWFTCGVSTVFLGLPLYFTRKQPKVCMFYLFLLLQKKNKKINRAEHNHL